MVLAGIEAMNVFGGTAFLDVMGLVEHRGLDAARFANLLMRQKAVALPSEDPVTFAVNAAAPIVAAMPEEERDRIEVLITCTESGIDFGKSLSTYVHHHLGLSRNCRLFEVKSACYSGTAGFQTAVNFILSQASPGAKALVVATDISRFTVVEGGDALTEDWSFAEPSSGAGAVAMLISDTPEVFQVDSGANGYYGHEVMDTCRPTADSEAGDADLSLMSYLNCCEQTFLEYRRRVADVDYRKSFHYLAFHTPFGGMVKGAHRTMMRRLTGAARGDIEEDFERRVLPGIRYCQRTGNAMGGTVFVSLASTIDNAEIDRPKRIGVFSYGSGCSSEFYSGVVTPRGQQRLRAAGIAEALDSRYPLSIDEYERLLTGEGAVRFGTRNWKLDESLIPAQVLEPGRTERLVLRQISEFHREYAWLR
ncbi:3-hydroxy-3-methylglutaryl-ACP synthase [Actinokineospora sp. PR83]|uniref:hydroxymethylglutaryl-CoA synthase family protein n=1 Tax=Actinokineospora sp. PR83 TaxID=2884908 RepID=UPI0027E07E13|nr:hydroxymethylglutaryl-CoA synthase [Actinokineospora sp. PR83]MCG8915252.1 3-hydroxy-3-methylglutaryl-ACP synthase [Actinokineospora sp. PR83]